MRRALVLTAVLAAAALFSSVQAAQASVATTIAAHLAEKGANAAIAHFSPELQAKLDPAGAGIEEIRGQLAALNQKLDELKLNQESLASRQLCATHITGLRTIVSDAITKLAELNAATQLKGVDAREARLDSLFAARGQLATEQHQLHQTIVDGALTACGKNLQDQMYPFLTSQLAPQVRDWYATYQSAAVALLVVRLNLYAYAAPTGTLQQLTETDANGVTRTLNKPVRARIYTEQEANALAATVTGWLAQEERLIKPAVPNTDSIDLKERIVFKTTVYANGLQDREAYRLFQEGWQASARDDPRCLQMTRVFDELGVSTSQTRSELSRRAILYITSPYIHCKDTHGVGYAFNVDARRYEDYGHTLVYVTRNVGTVLARPIDGFFSPEKLATWTYGK